MIGLLALLGLAAAVPVVTFGIVPLFVRSTLEEPPPAPVSAIAAADPVAVAPPVAPTPTGPELAGDLRKVDAVHYGSGRVTIGGPAGASVLRFEQVDIAGAPNMVVYLSDRRDGQPGRFTELGPLRATGGSFNYAIPAGTDLSSVHSVVIWCHAFNVTVTYAELSEPTR